MRNQKGITLVALVIIIVMLILVGVSVTIAIKGGLFTTARTATNNTNSEAEYERGLANGVVNYNGTMQTIDNIVNGKADEPAA